MSGETNRDHILEEVFVNVRFVPHERFRRFLKERLMAELSGNTLGQYQIIEEIGQGGMANVYRAIQPSVEREVAIKVMPAHFLQDRTFLQRFNREVKVIARMQHPHILRVYDFGEADGVPYIVMEYVPEGTLADVIREYGNTMPLEEAARLVEQIAGALDYATYLKRLASLPADVPLMIEHMQGKEEYDRSRRHLFQLGEQIGVSFG